MVLSPLFFSLFRCEAVIQAWILSHLAIFISVVVVGFLLILGLVLLCAWQVSRRKKKRLETDYYLTSKAPVYELE